MDSSSRGQYDRPGSFIADHSSQQDPGSFLGSHGTTEEDHVYEKLPLTPPGDTPCPERLRIIEPGGSIHVYRKLVKLIKRLSRLHICLTLLQGVVGLATFAILVCHSLFPIR